MLLFAMFGRKIANIKYVKRNAIESFNQDLWITTRGRQASTENVNDHCRLCINCALLFVFLELDQKGGCRYSDPGMLWNGPADLLGHFIGWTSNGAWSEMKFRFNVTDRVGMVWILMILVNYVMMMHGLWWCWWSLIYNVEKQWW
jgi:hypothetical protein